MRRILSAAGVAALTGALAVLLPPVFSAEGATAAPVSREARTALILGDVSKSWFRGEWEAYRARFVSADGRVVDNANGGISHSEGQGFGLLLALEADDAGSFERIWRWTAEHLRKRSDALFAWKWVPDATQATDNNNATDGDILIAWALSRAAKRFGRPEYQNEALAITTDIAGKLVRTSSVGPILMPAEQGFGPGDQPDGPVVNLSYWVFPALREFASWAPGADWNAVRRTGYRLLQASRFGPHRVPADWEALGGSSPMPAQNFSGTFGYDAIRIPLYLASDPDAPREALYAFATHGVDTMGGSHLAVIDVATGAAGPPMAGKGYRAAFALARCALHGEKIPPDLMSSRDDLYYPETLRLLSLSIVQERFTRCL